MIGLQAPHHHKMVYMDYYLNQAGGKMPTFVGARYQRGHGIGNILKTITRFALPWIKKGAQAMGRQALKTGVDIAGDVLAGENVKATAKRHMSQGLKQLVKQQQQQYLQQPHQAGKGGPPGQRIMKKNGHKRKAPATKPIISHSTKRRRRCKDSLS